MELKIMYRAKGLGFRAPNKEYVKTYIGTRKEVFNEIRHQHSHLFTTIFLFILDEQGNPLRRADGTLKTYEDLFQKEIQHEKALYSLRASIQSVDRNIREHHIGSRGSNMEESHQKIIINTLFEDLIKKVTSLPEAEPVPFLEYLSKLYGKRINTLDEIKEVKVRLNETKS